MKTKPLAALAAIAAATALVITGCAGSGGGSGSKDPIVVGSVNSISGPATFPEASQAAAAVFKQFNAAGGLNGRKIDYKALDDKGDPATATSSARQLVGQDGAVAMVGSASILECQLNAKYYAQQGVLSMPGVGVDTGCFDNPKTISPVNVGPYNDLTLTLMYGSETLKLTDICVLLEIVGSTKPAYMAAVQKWEEVTGKKPLYVDATLPAGGSDYTSYIVKARQAGCKAIASNPIEPDAIGQVKAANAQGWNDLTWLYLTSVYSTNFAKAVSNAGAGVYVPAEFYPFTDTSSSANKDWYDLMSKNNIPLTSFSQGGYLAATYFIDALKTIKGDVTKESVTKALQSFKAQNPMVGAPYSFGSANDAGWPVVLKSGAGAWKNAATDWLTISGH
ncbi:branched-chain amino acid ABC transporter substrate-binding protein [Microbacterium mangrovi]|uniref:Branched-chain amino acid ABC transporter substrate-binding protein n=1 Tax=Microbacterium mangrovi TaxID=1348253 RepID=A0A0B2A1L1_9MICO|nr:ABC transporter substrate-binding protein [Microbacterium mangrovi]KHK95485.1 branched-chain amino acid ABC transporter substrate-binding protein [Microbacterium mangrovi]